MPKRKSSYSGPWEPDEEHALIHEALTSGSAEKASERLPRRSAEACKKRLQRLRRMGVTTAEFTRGHPDGRRGSDKASQYSRKWVQRPGAENENGRDFRAEGDDAAFLADLRNHEKPPVDLEMKPGAQRVMHNPSSFHGSGCGSSAAIASEG